MVRNVSHQADTPEPIRACQRGGLHHLRGASHATFLSVARRRSQVSRGINFQYRFLEMTVG